MIFNTYWFLCTVVPFLLLYWLVPVAKIRLVLLLCYCALFHFHFAGSAGVLPIVVLAIITYACGLSGRKKALVAGIVICVLALCFYKYMLFVSDEIVAPLLPDLAITLRNAAVAILPASPPLAISFFTFEFVHYLVEVHKGGQPIKQPHRFAIFTIFFPSLVAGPIKRYGQFLPSLERGLKSIPFQSIVLGLLLVSMGFFKKLVIADNCAYFTDYKNSDAFYLLPTIERWAFLACLSFRIYMDFAGYSDIAIGLAKMMGIELPRNFNWPYFAVNLRDFWHRWHISLSTWIRDYIYIPLGGGRAGRLRTAINVAFAFALCGLWHGAHWNFVLWGLYHGLGLAICVSYPSMFGRVGKTLQNWLSKVPLLKISITYLFVSFGWLLFFYQPERAWKLFRYLFLPLGVKI